jgi:isopentenyl phosphate kinase
MSIKAMDALFMIIIKFGGSAITEKSKECTYRPEITKQLIGELARFYDTNFGGQEITNSSRAINSDSQMILVHGAGSFGHIKAKEYNLDEGYLGRSQLLGLSEVHRDVRDLNKLFMDDLLKYNFPAIAIPPLAIIKNDNKLIKSMDFSLFDSILGLGNIPLSYGDVVTDDTIKFSICSGDTIIQQLAHRYDPSHVIFLTSVDGLCSENPQKNEDAPLIRHLTQESFDSACTDQQINPDVTGGIFQKCQIALELAKMGIKTYIINGTKEGRFLEALIGGDVEGTTAQ